MGQGPLAQCCAPSRLREEEVSANATNKVELAVSSLFSMMLATAYHTSVVVNGEEFFFSDSGIFANRMMASHQGKPSERIELGYSSRTGLHLLAALRHHFMPGTYDLLWKNCNSFSDCAVAYLLRGRRLEGRFSAMEKLGKSNSEMVIRVTNGVYSPNAVAKDFDVDKTLAAIEKEAENGVPSVSGLNEHERNSPLSTDVQVNIVGLASATHLNGQGAHIVRFNPVNGRWEARLDMSGELKAFRAENLRPAGELVLQPGDFACVHGLASDAGQQLNGCECEIVKYLHEQRRYEVTIGQQTKALKAENLCSKS